MDKIDFLVLYDNGWYLVVTTQDDAIWVSETDLSPTLNKYRYNTEIFDGDYNFLFNNRSYRIVYSSKFNTMVMSDSGIVSSITNDLVPKSILTDINRLKDNLEIIDSTLDG